MNVSEVVDDDVTKVLLSSVVLEAKTKEKFAKFVSVMLTATVIEFASLLVPLFSVGDVKSINGKVVSIMSVRDLVKVKFLCPTISVMVML